MPFQAQFPEREWYSVVDAVRTFMSIARLERRMSATDSCELDQIEDFNDHHVRPSCVLAANDEWNIRQILRR